MNQFERMHWEMYCAMISGLKYGPIGATDEERDRWWAEAKVLAIHAYRKLNLRPVV